MTNLDKVKSLPVSDEIKFKIIKNTDKNIMLDDYENEPDDDWLACMFVYGKTEEGYDYWIEVESQLR